MFRNLMCLFFSLLFLGNAFAGELMSKEADAYYNEAVKLQQAYNFAGANALYQKILFIDSSNSKWPVLILNNRGAMFAQQGDIANAEIFFLKALEIDSNCSPAKFNLGLLYDQQGKELESIKYWLKALDIDLDKIRSQGFVLGKVEKPKN